MAVHRSIFYIDEIMPQEENDETDSPTSEIEAFLSQESPTCDPIESRTNDNYIGEEWIPRLKFLWSKWRLKVLHFRQCFEFFFLKVIILSLDVGTDMATAVKHFSHGNKYWAQLTLSAIFLPFVAKVVSIVIKQGKKWFNRNLAKDNMMQLASEASTSLPIFQTIRNLRILVGLFVTDTSLPQNSVLVNKLKMQAMDSGIFEAFLESAPQFILQCYIIIQTGQIHIVQYFGIPISFISLSWSCMMMFFTQRLGRYPDPSPTFKMKMIIYLFILFQLLGPLFSLVLMALYFREYIIVCIFLIVIINTTSLWLLYRVYKPNRFSELYPESELFKRRRVEDVQRIVITSGLTSWISTCSVLSRNYKIQSWFLMVSTTLSLLCHVVSICSIFILVSVENAMKISRYPFTHCFKESMFSENNTLGFSLANDIYLFKTIQVAKEDENTPYNPKVLRICDESEDSSNFYFYFLGPVAFILLMLSLVSSVCLQRLGDYSCWLFKKTKCLHFTVFQDRIISEDHQFDLDSASDCEEQLTKDILNKGDPLEGDTFFHCWAKANKELKEVNDFLRCMVVKGADANIENIYGQTPINFMTPDLKANLQSVIKINDTTENVNKTQKVWEEPPMHYLSQHNELFFAILLLFGGQLLSQDADGNTAILKLFGNDEAKSKILLNLIHWDIDQENKYIQATIFLAAERGLSNLLEFLLQTKAVQQGRDASVNMTNNDGQAAIYLAARGGHLECLKFLVANGALLDVKNDCGPTPLHLASEFGHLDVVKYLVQECNADVEVKNNDGRTPLHLAYEKGHIDVVIYLVKECNVEVDMKKKDGWTPLHRASQNGHLDVVKFLVKDCNTDVEVKNNNGMTPLHLASEKGHLDVVKYLVTEYNADVKVKNNYGCTPFHHASRYGHLDVVRFFVKECNADVEVKTRYGQAALHLASENGHFDVVKYLVTECKASVTSENNEGKKPIDVAKKREIKSFLSSVRQDKTKLIELEIRNLSFFVDLKKL